MTIEITYEPRRKSVETNELHVGDTLRGKVGGTESVYLYGPSVLIDLNCPSRIWIDHNATIFNAELVDLKIAVTDRKDC